MAVIEFRSIVWAACFQPRLGSCITYIFSTPFKGSTCTRALGRGVGKWVTVKWSLEMTTPPVLKKIVTITVKYQAKSFRTRRLTWANSLVPSKGSTHTTTSSKVVDSSSGGHLFPNTPASISSTSSAKGWSLPSSSSSPENPKYNFVIF